MPPLADTFADIGATIADNFQTTKPKYGKAFYLYYNRGLFLERQNRTCTALLKNLPESPKIGLILGSGLGILADEIENPVKLKYEDIPEFPVSTVEGHAGQLVLGTLEGVSVIAMQGRFHFYEGYSMEKVTFLYA